MFKVQCILHTEGFAEVTVESEGVEHALGPTIPGGCSSPLYFKMMQIEASDGNMQSRGKLVCFGFIQEQLN